MHKRRSFSDTRFLTMLDPSMQINVVYIPAQCWLFHWLWLFHFKKSLMAIQAKVIEYREKEIRNTLLFAIFLFHQYCFLNPEGETDRRILYKEMEILIGLSRENYCKL